MRYASAKVENLLIDNQKYTLEKDLAATKAEFEKQI
tara:strand:+ start:1332 stop:1439 length:108 start_codon:yes stop_codon:yes gene_type:complete